MARRRAHGPADKAARRTEILVAAGRLFDDRQGRLDDLTMAALARDARLAKGTLYLYFRSKEEIFLALLLDELRRWLRAMDRALSALPADRDADALATAIVHSIQPRTRLLRLLALLHPVLERRLPAELIVDFKRQLDQVLAEPARRLEAQLPMLGEGEGMRFVVRLHALVVGFQLATRPPPGTAEAMADADLAHLELDFAVELQATLAALLRGWAG